MMRPSGRMPDELRRITITNEFTKPAAGSVLIAFGDTKVICTASVENQVPGFLRGSGQGWITSEYGMLPAATNTRSQREAAKGKQSIEAICINHPGKKVAGEVLVMANLFQCFD